MQTLGNFIKQHGYASLDGCIELHSHGIFTDEVWLWCRKTALEGQLPGIKAQDFHGLLSAAIARIIEKAAMPFLQLMARAKHCCPRSNTCPSANLRNNWRNTV